MSLIPRTISARDLQKGYRKIFDDVKSGNSPVFVMNKNKPDVAIVSLDFLDNLINQVEFELADTREALNNYHDEKKNAKLKRLDNPKDLLSA